MIMVLSRESGYDLHKIHLNVMEGFRVEVMSNHSPHVETRLCKIISIVA